MAKKLTAKSSLKAVAADLLATPELSMIGRSVTDVSEMSTPVTLTIGQVFKLVLERKLMRNNLQRNDKMRLLEGRAEHVTKYLHSAHLDIVIAFYNGQYHLIDGCHRISYWVECLTAELPSHVTVLLKKPQSEEEYFSLYNAYDSSKSVKKNADAIYGYMRAVGIENDVTSHLMRTCGIVTAFKNLCKGAVGLNQVETMKLYAPAMILMDQHNLKTREIPQGFVQAAISLYHTEADKAMVKAYVSELTIGSLKGLLTVSPPTQLALSKYNAYYAIHKGSGETNCANIAAIVEVGFDAFRVAFMGTTAKSTAKKVPAAARSAVSGFKFV